MVVPSGGGRTDRRSRAPLLYTAASGAIGGNTRAMEMNAVGRTALWTAAARARESFEPRAAPEDSPATGAEDVKCPRAAVRRLGNGLDVCSRA